MICDKAWLLPEHDLAHGCVCREAPCKTTSEVKVGVTAIVANGPSTIRFPSNTWLSKSRDAKMVLKGEVLT